MKSSFQQCQERLAWSDDRLVNRAASSALYWVVEHDKPVAEQVMAQSRRYRVCHLAVERVLLPAVPKAKRRSPQRRLPGVSPTAWSVYRDRGQANIANLRKMLADQQHHRG
ncbi:hypothetical protein [Ferrimonas marina]|uniref:Uncharacterized protein n=1 Tax=Ferrimonas marina TaxID=299255 RepID=A0A1M5TX45_9GAMM|nr:hypothetical protein [Ferrimonas marina]SHH55367.1 hypothetical protein SAMN02745129_2315 [Ferrimonas marina]